MEFFNNAKAVRLKSHLDKYLVADDDEGTVRQSHDGASRRARWHVEPVEGNPHVIRLRSAQGGLYLAASDESYLLGMTGKKVLLQQASSSSDSKRSDASVEWEPIKEGYRVKLRTRGGKFLRANGATPPWRNSVTHDLPHRTATQDWVMWDVDVVDVSVLGDEDYLPRASDATAASFSGYSSSGANSPLVGSPAAAEGLRKSMFSEYSSSPNSPRVGPGGSPVAAAEGLRKSIFGAERRRRSIVSERSVYGSGREDGMEFFSKAKAVRLQSHLGKYLVADDDEATVRQSRNGASRNARWAVEFVEGKPDRLRLMSCHGLYLTAAEEPFLLGMTGKKVLQTPPENQAGAAVEWQPVKEGPSVKLMTEHCKFLRANGGAPPWRNSVTHDVPHRTATQSWVLWAVEIVDIMVSDPGSGWLSQASSFDSVADNYSGSPDNGSPVESWRAGSGNMSMKKAGGEESGARRSEGRMIYYCEVDDDGNFSAEVSFQFRGYGLEDLTEKLEDATGLEDVIVCSRNVLNGKLYPLRLALPPNNATMHVVVVPPTSKVANEFLPPAPSST